MDHGSEACGRWRAGLADTTQELLTVEELTDHGLMVARLSTAGLSEVSAVMKAKLFARVAHHLMRMGVGPVEPVCAFYVPGRIEVLGKHTDYCGGRSLLATVDRGFCIVAAPSADRSVHVVDVEANQDAQFQIDPHLLPPVGQWLNYPMTVARRVARNFPRDLRGARIAFASDLVPAAGMSSSSAMMIAIFFALSQVNNLAAREEYQQNIDSVESLAGYLATIENGASFGTLTGDTGVGTFGGSEDHTAILVCRANALAQYRFCPVKSERSIAMPRNYVFAIAGSGVLAEKTGEALDKYNRASRLASAAIDIWRKATGQDDPHLAAAIERSPEAAEQVREVLGRAKHEAFTSRQLLNRFEHFLAEHQQIIPAAGDALAEADLVSFGEWVEQSQVGAENLLGNQVPETICLAKSARQFGAAAASAFGAGFGGSVWALVKIQIADAFLEAWARDYRDHFPGVAAAARFFTTCAGPAAFAVPVG